jgi:hypothetical protein
MSQQVRHPWSLNDEEYAAVMALQVGAPVPPRDHPLWLNLIAAELVWLDLDGQPGVIRLTPMGRRYPAPA